jgi:hypothetical protein
MKLRFVAVALLTMVILASAAVAQTPKSPADQHYQKGLDLKKAGKTDEAIAELEKAVAADPNKAGPHWVLGWLYANKAQKDKAIDEFSKYLELAPTSSNAQKAKDAISRLGGAAAPPKPGAVPAPGGALAPSAKHGPTPPPTLMPKPGGAAPLTPPVPGAAGAEEAEGARGGMPRLLRSVLFGAVVGVSVFLVLFIIGLVKKRKAAPTAAAPEAAPQLIVPPAPASPEVTLGPATAAPTAVAVNMQFLIQGDTPAEGALQGLTASVDKASRQLHVFNPADNTTQTLPLDDIGDSRLDRDAGGPYIAIAMRDGQRHYWLRGDEAQLTALYGDITS